MIDKKDPNWTYTRLDELEYLYLPGEWTSVAI